MEIGILNNHLDEIKEELIKQELLQQEQFDAVVQENSQKGLPANGSSILKALVDKRIVSEEEVLRVAAKVAGILYVDLKVSDINSSTLRLLDFNFCRENQIACLGENEQDGSLIVAMVNADDIHAKDYLQHNLQRNITPCLASAESIDYALKQYEFDIGQLIDLETPAAAAGQELDKPESQGVDTTVSDSPVVNVINAILRYAAENKASDIHIEPTEKKIVVRVRLDGVLKIISELPKNLLPAVIARIKIISNLKIDEQRIPQDGRSQIKGYKIDLRIAIAPTIWGEQVVIRLLDAGSVTPELGNLGYRGPNLARIKESLKNTNGMILTSGPTGSGKSTSLYALINEIKDEKIKVITLEDPVENKMPGVSQIQVNNQVGLTFASGLKSILRMDPEVVVVGEIRDKETAILAVQASLTGHLVFSTLHTNSAAGILPRLLDMGVEPFLIASTVRTVIGQRLGRRVSGKNKVVSSDQLETKLIRDALTGVLPNSADEAKEREEILDCQNLPLINSGSFALVEGIDSPGTPGGYKGRVGFYEVFNVTESIQQLILNRATSSEIQKTAQEEGMLTMRQDGYLKALEGMTTIEEVERVVTENSS